MRAAVLLYKRSAFKRFTDFVLNYWHFLGLLLFIPLTTTVSVFVTYDLIHSFSSGETDPAYESLLSWVTAVACVSFLYFFVIWFIRDLRILLRSVKISEGEINNMEVQESGGDPVKYFIEIGKENPQRLSLNEDLFSKVEIGTCVRIKTSEKNKYPVEMWII